MADRPTYVWTGSEWDTVADPGAVRKSATNLSNATTLEASAATSTPLVVKTAASQSVNAVEVRNSANTVRARIDSTSGVLGVGINGSTETAALQLGTGRSGNGFSVIDLVGDATYTSFGMRLIRLNDGSNAQSQIVHRGTGDFLIINDEVSGFAVQTDSTERFRITGTGRVQLPAGGVLEAPVSTNAQTTSYTLVLTDAGRLIEINSASATTLTIPADASVAFPVGTKIDVLQTGAGQITIAGSGFTPNATPGLKISAQWGAATLVKRGTNSWVVIGNLSA